MSTEHAVYMTKCNVDSSLCGWDCIFRKGAGEYDCSLFSMDLDDNDTYQDQNEDWLKLRCSQCFCAF